MVHPLTTEEKREVVSAWVERWVVGAARQKDLQNSKCHGNTSFE